MRRNMMSLDRHTFFSRQPANHSSQELTNGEIVAGFILVETCMSGVVYLMAGIFPPSSMIIQPTTAIYIGSSMLEAAILGTFSMVAKKSVDYFRANSNQEKQKPMGEHEPLLGNKNNILQMSGRVMQV